MAKTGYHHGNLREELIRASLSLIQKKGPTGFTLSEAAREAGVTPAAVYRHFSGRDDLVAAAALQGFELFAARLQKAYAAEASPLEAFKATGAAYLSFARDHSGHYIAMFESGIARDHSPDLQRAADHMEAVLHSAADRLTQDLPPETQDGARHCCAHMMALSHGIVELYSRTKSGPCPAEMLERGLEVYLAGLGLTQSA